MPSRWALTRHRLGARTLAGCPNNPAISLRPSARERRLHRAKVASDYHGGVAVNSARTSTRDGVLLWFSTRLGDETDGDGSRAPPVFSALLPILLPGSRSPPTRKEDWL